MKILVITKDRKSKGGVVNFISLFFDVFSSDDFELLWCAVGTRSYDYYKPLKRKLLYPIEFMVDIIKIFLTLFKDSSIKIVHLNPSMIPVPLLRDTVILIMCKLLRRKVVVFFHGWNDLFAETLFKQSLVKKVFVIIYKRADHILVLAEQFKKTLTDIGLKKDSITVIRTMYDKRYCHFDFSSNRRNKEKESLNCIFLSRLCKDKGIFEIVDAARLLKDKEVNFTIEFYGYFKPAEIENEFREKISKHNLQNNVLIKGFAGPEAKYSIMSEADVFLLPTTHPEGCPTAVIEAFACGCFVISTGSGALKDIVMDKKNGIIVKPENIEDLADKIIWAWKNLEYIRSIKSQTSKYSEENFEAEIICNKIRNVYYQLSSS